MGILAVLLTIVGWHVVSGFLFVKAIAKRGIKKAMKNMEEEQQGKYVDYEVVEEDDFLELPESNPQKKTSHRNNEYDDLFK
jgi:hypothetical protein